MSNSVLSMIPNSIKISEKFQNEARKTSSFFNKRVNLSQLNLSASNSSLFANTQLNPKKPDHGRSKSNMKNTNKTKQISNFTKSLTQSQSFTNFLANTQQIDTGIDSSYFSNNKKAEQRNKNHSKYKNNKAIKIIKKPSNKHQNSVSIISQKNLFNSQIKPENVYSETTPITKNYFVNPCKINIIQASKKNSIKSLNLSFSAENSEKSFTNYFGGTKFAVNRGKEMKENLIKIEKNKEKIPNEQLAFKIKNLLKDYLNEIIQVLPHFSYVLQKVYNLIIELEKNTNEKLQSELTSCKLKNMGNIQKISELEKKCTTQEAINKALKQINEKLEKENVDLKLKLFDTRTKLTEAIESGITNKIASEIDLVYEENKKYKHLANNLKNELKKAQIRENALISLMQGTMNNSELVKENEEDREKNINTSQNEGNLIEVGKKKIKIPKLDFSNLERSFSSSSSEEQSKKQENYSELESYFLRIFLYEKFLFSKFY